MITSNQITFIDMTDNRTLEVFLTSNNPTVQTYNPNTGQYFPSWEFTNLIVTPKIFVNSMPITSGATISWTRQDGAGEAVVLDQNIGEYGTSTKMTVTKNVLDSVSSGVITYICTVVYDGMTAVERISFAIVRSGKDSLNKTMLNASEVSHESPRSELINNIENYKYLEICYHSSNGIYDSVNIRSFNADTVQTVLNVQAYENNALILRQVQIRVSQNIVTLTNDVKINIQSGETIMQESDIIVDAIYGII